MNEGSLSETDSVKKKRRRTMGLSESDSGEEGTWSDEAGKAEGAADVGDNDCNASAYQSVSPAR